MSSSGIRPADQLHRSRRAGPDRGARHGFSRIPEVARPVVMACLEEAGLGAIYDLCAGLRLDLSEILHLRSSPSDFVLNDEVIPLPPETKERILAFQSLLEKSCSDTSRQATWLANSLSRVTTQVRKRLRGRFAWADHVVVNQATLHQIADEEAHRRLGESPEALRAFRRDPRASANSVRPATTVGVGDAFS